MKFTAINKPSPRFLCFCLPAWSFKLDIRKYKGHSFEADRLECWRSLQIQTPRLSLRLEFSSEVEMAYFVIVLNFLHEFGLKDRWLNISYKKVLAKVFATKLQFISQKQLGFKNAPIMLAIGILNYLEKLNKDQGKVRKSLVKIG
jgi:hypothetical protein